MGRFQITISVLLIIASALGLSGIVRWAFIGSDDITMMLFGFMLVVAWMARTMILRMPIAHEAIVRIHSVAPWGEWSPVKRRVLYFLDWPLYSELRRAEAKRLRNEPLISIDFDLGGMTLRPVSHLHVERYFLVLIASCEGYGLVATIVPEQCVYFNWQDADQRVRDHFNNQIGDRRLISLNILSEALEGGFVSTLTETDRYKFFVDRR